MKMRHKKATGGAADSEWDKESKGSKEVKAYDAQGSHVEEEAEDKREGGEMKKGGRVKKRAGGGCVEGEKPKARLDRMKRKSGGRVGSDLSPLSSSHKAEKVRDHMTDDM